MTGSGSLGHRGLPNPLGTDYALQADQPVEHHHRIHPHR